MPMLKVGTASEEDARKGETRKYEANVREEIFQSSVNTFCSGGEQMHGRNSLA